MHILIVNQHVLDFAGGSETQCHEIALGLLKLGHTVTYAVCDPGRQRYDVPYATYLLNVSFAKAFGTALAELKPDVVYWRRNKRDLLRCVLAARRRGVRFVFAISTALDVRMVPPKRVRDGERLSPLRRTARTARRALDVARFMINQAAVPLVDGVVFQHAGQVPPGFRGRHTIIYNSYPHVEAVSVSASAQVPYVLWVGNLKKVKKPDTFLRLAADLRDSGAEFWMVGGIQDPAYGRLVGDSSALPASFRYLGPKSQKEVDSLMKGSLFLVNTSDDEGFPNVFIHAWLQHRGVVSLYVDLGNLLATEGIGICSGDYATFKADVARLFADAAARNEMGERAFRFAVANCDPVKNVKALEIFLFRVTSS